MGAAGRPRAAAAGPAPARRRHPGPAARGRAGARHRDDRQPAAGRGRRPGRDRRRRQAVPVVRRLRHVDSHRRSTRISHAEPDSGHRAVRSRNRAATGRTSAPHPGRPNLVVEHGALRLPATDRRPTCERLEGSCAVFDDVSSSALRVALAGLAAAPARHRRQHRQHRDPRLPGRQGQVRGGAARRRRRRPLARRAVPAQRAPLAGAHPPERQQRQPRRGDAVATSTPTCATSSTLRALDGKFALLRDVIKGA